eukprot:Pgem_evm2s6287
MFKKRNNLVNKDLVNLHTCFVKLSNGYIRSIWSIRNKFFMGLALLSSYRSKDPHMQVGSCIFDDENQVRAVGYNGFPWFVETQPQSNHNPTATTAATTTATATPNPNPNPNPNPSLALTLD